MSNNDKTAPTTYNCMDMQGKQVLILGCGSGMGKQTAIVLSKLNAKLILLDNREKEMKQTLSLLQGEGHHGYVFDLSHTDQIDAMMKQITDECGPVDGLVHCAARFKKEDLNGMTDADFHLDYAINFLSYVCCIRGLDKAGALNPGSSIVGISSLSAELGIPKEVSYSSTKGAMNSASLCLAAELIDRGIRVNYLQPGWVRTEIFDDYMANISDPEAEMARIKGKQPMGVIETNDIANTIAFLLSDAARTITGAAINIDGGYGLDI